MQAKNKIMENEIEIILDDKYIYNLDTYEKINNIWDVNLKNKKYIFVPGWSEMWNKKENKLNFSIAKGIIFETISLYELRKVNNNLYYIGKRTSKQGFDLVLLDKQSNDIWIGECKWRKDGQALKESFRKFFQQNEYSSDEINELHRIIESFRLLDIEKTKYLINNEQRRKIIKIFTSIIDDRDNIDNFISCCGAPLNIKNDKFNIDNIICLNINKIQILKININLNDDKKIEEIVEKVKRSCNSDN